MDEDGYVADPRVADLHEVMEELRELLARKGWSLEEYDFDPDEVLEGYGDRIQVWVKAAPYIK